jgi:D-psicose/D-tagatose/L-ribulose 3-epimerase
VRIAVSNIAWDRVEDERIQEFMRRSGTNGLEIAPSKIWEEPLSTEPQRVDDYRSWWNARGINIVALQALLFGHPELVLFRSAEARERMFLHLASTIALASRLGAGVLVLGAPKNRQRSDGWPDDIWGVAVDFFRRLGAVAVEHGTSLCIEPNPVEYGCDFIVNSSEGAALVRDVDSPGFGLHLDAAALTLSGEDPYTSIEASATLIRHFHASEPSLAPVHGGGTIDHDAMARALRNIGYAGWVSIEMRSTGSLESVAQALDFVGATYGQS